MNDTELEAKKKLCRELAIEIRDAEEAKRAEKEFPAVKKLVGTFQKYRNCYSCPVKESDYWWIYRRIKEVRKDGIMIVDRFQIDKHGDVRIETGKEEQWEYGIKDWLPATEGEFHEGALRAKAALDKLLS